MNVTIVSYFRNSESYIERYCNQMDELQSLLSRAGDTLRLVLGYGDSTDKTHEALFEECLHRFNCSLIDVSHGGPIYGSVPDLERFKQLAFIGNKLWSHLPTDSNIVGLVESDLIWQGHVLQSLLNAVEGHSAPCIMSPMVIHQSGVFYDTWAFRRGLRNFTAHYPYHPALLEDIRYLEMDSVGSVVFLPYSLAVKLHWPEKDVVVGFCKQAEAKGASIILDTELKVYHP